MFLEKRFNFRLLNWGLCVPLQDLQGLVILDLLRLDAENFSAHLSELSDSQICVGLPVQQNRPQADLGKGMSLINATFVLENRILWLIISTDQILERLILKLVHIVSYLQIPYDHRELHLAGFFVWLVKDIIDRQVIEHVPFPKELDLELTQL